MLLIKKKMPKCITDEVVILKNFFFNKNLYLQNADSEKAPHIFYSFVLLKSIPSETTILS